MLIFLCYSLYNWMVNICLSSHLILNASLLALFANYLICQNYNCNLSPRSYIEILAKSLALSPWVPPPPPLHSRRLLCAYMKNHITEESFQYKIFYSIINIQVNAICFRLVQSFCEKIIKEHYYRSNSNLMQLHKTNCIIRFLDFPQVARLL